MQHTSSTLVLTFFRSSPFGHFPILRYHSFVYPSSTPCLSCYPTASMPCHFLLHFTCCVAPESLRAIDKGRLGLVSKTDMKRVLGMVGLLVFVLAKLVLPAAHTHSLCCEHASSHTEQHESSEHMPDLSSTHAAGHNSSGCPICQLAYVPVSTAAPVELALGLATESERIHAPQLRIVATLTPRANGSRAPPASA